MNRRHCWCAPLGALGVSSGSLDGLIGLIIGSRHVFLLYSSASVNFMSLEFAKFDCHTLRFFCTTLCVAAVHSVAKAIAIAIAMAIFGNALVWTLCCSAVEGDLLLYCLRLCCVFWKFRLHNLQVMEGVVACMPC